MDAPEGVNPTNTIGFRPPPGDWVTKSQPSFAVDEMRTAGRYPSQMRLASSKLMKAANAQMLEFFAAPEILWGQKPRRLTALSASQFHPA